MSKLFMHGGAKGHGEVKDDWHKAKNDRKLLKRQKKEDKAIKQLERESDAKRQRDAGVELKEKRRSGQAALRTVTVAVPGSILDNAQSAELRTYLAGQIARAVAIFNVHEVVVYDEQRSVSFNEDEEEYFTVTGKSNGTIQLAKVLQYLECPQYLRKAFFPPLHDLRFAGLLNPLDAPHHCRESDQVTFREGIVLDKPVKHGKGSFVDVGLWKECQIDRQIKPGTRVTIKLDKSSDNSEGSGAKGDSVQNKKIKGEPVSPSLPRVEENLYWGYKVRISPSLSHVWEECPFKGGYDVTMGTSEKGTTVSQFEMPDYKHLLVVFGGLGGLEAAVEGDDSLKDSDPATYFQHYVNTCPDQGSRTIRTEEAILISLSALSPGFK